MGSWETVGKALKHKASPALQNRWNIGGMLGGKWIWQENEQFHTLQDVCPANDREKKLSSRANSRASQLRDKSEHRRIWGLQI